MAAKDDGPDERPSLELPTLGGLLRRRRAPAPDGDPEATSTPVPESAESAPAREAEGAPVEETPADEAPTEVIAHPAAATAPDEPEPASAPPQPDPEPTRPLYADEAPRPAAATPPPTDSVPAEEDEPPAATRRRGITLPTVSGMVVAPVTGAVVGLLAVGATWLALAGCELARGTSSCGGGPGFLLVVALLIVLVLTGRTLLRAFGVADAGSTSFLAVGLLTVVVLLILIDVVFSPWMVLVIPLVTAGTFTLSHWVTRLVDES